MALVKCKECGEQVSTKAKTCPKCGAKAPKKTSLFTWFVLAFIIFLIYAANQSPTSSQNIQNITPQASVSASTNAAQTQKTNLSKNTWEHFTSKDKMTGEKSAYTSSPVVQPTKRMGFPYSDINAQLQVGCDARSEWVYIGFNNAPNLSDTEIQDGYHLIRTQIKWDEQIENVTLIQKWGASFIHFRNAETVIANIANSNSALLELQWHGEQATYFEFPLSGSSSALKAIRGLCSEY